MRSKQTKLQPLLPSHNKNTNDPIVSSLLVNKVAFPVNMSKHVHYSKANEVHKLLRFPISDHGPNTETARAHVRHQIY